MKWFKFGKEMFRLSSIALFGMAVGVGAMCQASNARGQSVAKPPSSATREKQEAVIVLGRYSSDYWNSGPSYMLIMYADGRVAYIGQNNVKTKGLVEARIDKREVEHLVSEARRINFHSLRDKYTPEEGCPGSLADAGSAYISILIDGKRKSIDHYLGCSSEASKGHENFPPGLYELGYLIDRVVNSQQWIR